MRYIRRYHSPLGEIQLCSEGDALTGLRFEQQGEPTRQAESSTAAEKVPVLRQAVAWLDAYFAGQKPAVRIPLRYSGTPFQCEVWEILREIPYGKTVTYGEIAARIAARRGILRMSARAVGAAAGRNEIAILIPCHRVIGADGDLTGYAGGLERKEALLRLEGAWQGGLCARQE